MRGPRLGTLLGAAAALAAAGPAPAAPIVDGNAPIRRALTIVAR